MLLCVQYTYAVNKIMDDNLTIEYRENLSQDRDVALLSERFAETITVSQEDDVEPVVPTEQSSFPAESNTEGKCKLTFA